MMIADIEEEVSRYIMKAQVRENLQREAVVKDTKAVAGNEQGEQKPQQPYVRKSRVGRNDPCPCGSGKKYKHCCGR